MKKKEPVSVGELARRSGVPVSTIKYYVRKGLLPPPRKLGYNRSLYDPGMQKRLSLIKYMTEGGLSLESVKGILDKYALEAISDWEEFKKKAGQGGHLLSSGDGGLALTNEDRRKREIIEAATKAFSSKGYRRVSMDDVAREAGLSKGTCYKYFKSKEDLFLACVDGSLAGFFDYLEETGSTAEGALQRLLMKGLSFINRYPEFYFMMSDINSEAAGGNRRLAAKAISVYGEVAQYLARDIEAGVAEGTFRAGLDAESVGYSLISIIEFVGRMHLMDESLNPLEFLIRQTDFLMRGISA